MFRALAAERLLELFLAAKFPLWPTLVPMWRRPSLTREVMSVTVTRTAKMAPPAISSVCGELTLQRPSLSLVIVIIGIILFLLLLD